ncbi:uncharacterized protein [Amphiura filiformis]|uniref:uncharacterized protein n=1 Tax=Amphiura filiformis TaxID=82378 RepID=UPI003B22151A
MGGDFTLALEDEVDDVVAADETESSDGVPSLPSYNSDNAMLQMTQMMKVIGENIRDKIRRKQSSAQHLTETSIKTAQNQVSKLWAGQHKARRRTQEEFQDKLLTQIVGLETDLNEMATTLNKSQTLLQQHQHKVSTTLMNHVKKVHKLESEYRKEGETLEVELGQHLVRNVKGILRLGLSDMQKKMTQDVQHHEIQSMKRSLQSFLL